MDSWFFEEDSIQEENDNGGFDPFQAAVKDDDIERDEEVNHVEGESSFDEEEREIVPDSFIVHNKKKLKQKLLRMMTRLVWKFWFLQHQIMVFRQM